jgi:hypothetical protein
MRPDRGGRERSMAVTGVARNLESTVTIFMSDVDVVRDHATIFAGCNRAGCVAWAAGCS